MTAKKNTTWTLKLYACIAADGLDELSDADIAHACELELSGKASLESTRISEIISIVEVGTDESAVVERWSEDPCMDYHRIIELDLELDALALIKLMRRPVVKAAVTSVEGA